MLGLIYFDLHMENLQKYFCVWKKKSIVLHLLSDFWIRLEHQGCLSFTSLFLNWYNIVSSLPLDKTNMLSLARNNVHHFYSNSVPLIDLHAIMESVFLVISVFHHPHLFFKGDSFTVFNWIKYVSSSFHSFCHS